MHILAGLTQGITSAGAPSPLAAQLNKLVMKAMKSLDSYLSSNFSEKGKHLATSVYMGTPHKDALILQVHAESDDIEPIVVFVINSDGLHVFSRVIDLGTGKADTIDHVGSMKWRGVTSQHLKEALLYSIGQKQMWLGFDIKAINKSIESFIRLILKSGYLKSNIQSSTRINATIVDFMEKIKDYYGITDNKIKFQLMPVADAHASSMRYELSSFGDALFFLVKHPKIKEDLWCKVYDSMSSGKIELFFRDGETWTGYYVYKDPTYSLPPFMKGLEAIRWQTTLDSKSKKAVEAMIYGWKYYIRNISDSRFSRI